MNTIQINRSPFTVNQRCNTNFWHHPFAWLSVLFCTLPAMTASLQGQCCSSSGSKVSFRGEIQAVPGGPSIPPVTAMVDGAVFVPGQIIELGVGWHTLSYRAVHQFVGDTTGASLQHEGCGSTKCVIYQDSISGEWRIGDGVGMSLHHDNGADQYGEGGIDYGDPVVPPHGYGEGKPFYVFDPSWLQGTDPGDEGGDAAPDGGGGGSGGSFDPSQQSTPQPPSSPMGGSFPPVLSITQSTATFSLGSYVDGESRGWLFFSGDLASSTSTPVSLASISVFAQPTSSYGEKSTEFYYQGSQVLQALANDVLANIVEVANGVIEIRYYRADQLVSDDFGPVREPAGDPNELGPFTVDGGEAPFKVLEIRHMDAGLPTESIRYQTKVGGEVTSESTFSAVAGGGGSFRRIVSGTRVFESTETTVAAAGGSRAQRIVDNVEKAVQSDSTEVVVSNIHQVFETFTWGLEELVEETRHAGAVTETDLYSYYDLVLAAGTTAPPEYGRLKSLVRSDGTWQMFEYEAERVERQFSGLLGQPAPASPAAIARTGSNVGQDCRTRVVGPRLERSQSPVWEHEYIAGVLVLSIERTPESDSFDPLGRAGTWGKTSTTVAGIVAPLVSEEWRETIVGSGSDVTRTGAARYAVGADGMAQIITDESSPDDDIDPLYLDDRGARINSLAAVSNLPMLVPGKTMRSSSYAADDSWGVSNYSARWVWTGPLENSSVTYGILTQEAQSGGWRRISASGTDAWENDFGQTETVEQWEFDDASSSFVTTSVAGHTYTGTLDQRETTINTTSSSGTQTVTKQNDRGEVIESVLAGYAALPAPISSDEQPDVTTTITIGINSVDILKTTTSVVASSGQSYFTSESTDPLGHPASRVDAVGDVTTYHRAPAVGTTGVIEIELQTGDADVDGQRGRVTEYYLDGRLKSITGRRVIAEYHTYYLETVAAPALPGEIEEVHFGTESSPRFTRVCRNALGRVLWEETPNPAEGEPETVRTVYSYNSKGQLAGIQRPGMAQELIEYDELGQVSARGLDLDDSGSLERTGADPLTETDSYYEEDGGALWQVTRQRQYHKDGAANYLETVTKRKQNAGRDSEVITMAPDGSKVKETTVVNFDDRLRTVTRKTYRPGATEAEAITTTQTWANGLLVAESIPGETEPMRFKHDALRRMVKTIDPRTATGKRFYAGNGQLEWEENAAGERTTYQHHSYWANQGSHLKATGHDGTTREWFYDFLGRTTHQLGTASYPVQYIYDPVYGDMTGMKTWRTFVHVTQGGDLTQWAYQERTGKLLSKTSGSTTTYTYRSDGSLLSRDWQRTLAPGSQTTVQAVYSHDTAGRLTGITYNDGTPPVTFTPTRSGRVGTVTDASGTRTLSYERTDGGISAEVYSSGLLDELSVEHPEVASALPTSVVLKRAATTLSSTTHTRHAATGRMGGVSVEAGGLPASTSLDWSTSARGLPGRMTYSGTGLELSRSEESGAGLKKQTVALKRSASGPVLSSTEMTGPYRPTANSVRSSTSVRDGVTWTYLFNNRLEMYGAQALLAHRTQPDEQGQTAAGQPAQVGYSMFYNYDSIGNRISLEYPGTGLLGGAGMQFFTCNSANQYTQISRPYGEWKLLLGTASEHGYVSAWLGNGTGTPLDLVVNRAQRPQDEAGQLGFISRAAVSSTAPLWKELHVTAEHKGPNPPTGGSMSHRSGYLYFPPMTETFAYDADGNMTDDARWHYGWDAENRMISVETRLTAAAAGVPRQRLTFTYDSQHRRVRKKVESFSTTGQTWSVTSDTRFLYDGWNLIAEFEVNLQSQIANLKCTYAWGLDLSGSTQGAGGVGGLVSVTEYATDATTGAAVAVRMLAPAYDTNGNIMAYADIATGAVTHRFEYDPFGRPLTVSYADGTEAPPFRFSTKYLDEETGLYYYGFRYYSPELGRWLSSDPIGERGGINLYGMVGNDPVNRWDLLGQSTPMGHLAPYLWPGLADKPDHFPDSVWEAVFGSQEFKDYLSSLEKIAERNAQVLRTTTAKGPGMNAHIHVQDTQGMDFLQKAHATVIAGGIDVEVTKNHEIKINCEWSRPPRCGCVATSTLYVYISDNYGFGDYSGDQNGNWGNTALKWLSAVPSLGGAQNYTLTDNREYQWTYGFSPK